MNKKREILFKFFLLIFASIPVAKAQTIQRCGTTEYEQFILSNNPGLDSTKQAVEKIVNHYIQTQAFQNFKTANSVILIPVVVHIIGDHAISLVGVSEVEEQINILNQDYRKISGTNGAGAGVDTKIEFCIATKDQSGSPTGGVFTYSGTYAEWDQIAPDADANSDLKLKSIAHWLPAEYINIYVADLCCNRIGYSIHPWMLSYLPERDGIVIDPDNFGNNATDVHYNAGRTATHEVGHWLGLKHTWGDGSDCTGNDEVDDTPICSGTNFADYSLGCTPHNTDCTAENTAVGLTDLRQIENYLDYSDDLCMNMFTQGQADRMLGFLNSIRLYTSFSSCIDHCGNEVQDQDETGVDCGGSACPPCIIPPVLDDCDACFPYLRPFFTINGKGENNYHIAICENVPITIENLPSFNDPDCIVWKCTNTFFSIQESDYSGTAIGTEYSTWFTSIGDFLYMQSLLALSGGTLETAKYYRIKLAISKQGDWLESVKILYVAPRDIYLNNFNLTNNPSPFNPFDPFNPFKKDDFYVSTLFGSDITLQNVTTTNSVTTNNITFLATNSITILPNTTITGNFTAGIVDSECSSNRMANPNPDEDNLSDKYPNSRVLYYNSKSTSLTDIIQEPVSKNNNPEDLTLKSVEETLPSLIPNPSSSGKFTLSAGVSQSTNFNITVYNLLGEEILHSVIRNLNYAIDISTQPKGVYFVKITNGDEFSLQKIVYQ